MRISKICQIPLDNILLSSPIKLVHAIFLQLMNTHKNSETDDRYDIFYWKGICILGYYKVI